MLLALHADDLGFSPPINDGIVDAIRSGLLTGASLLANAPAAAAALEIWRRIDAERREGRLPSGRARHMLGDSPQPFDLGVHLNLSQGTPLTGAAFPATLLGRDGTFAGTGTFVRLMAPGASRHADAVRRELASQIEFVLDHAVRPVRLDGHQYCELTPLVGRIVSDLAARYGIEAVRVAREPACVGTLLRSRGARGITRIPGALTKRLLAAVHDRRARRARLRYPTVFFGSVTAGRVGLTELERFLRIGARRNASSVEIGLHPALPSAGAESFAVDQGAAWHDPLADVRPAEHRWLTDEALPDWLLRHGVRLGRVA